MGSHRRATALCLLSAMLLLGLAAPTPTGSPPAIASPRGQDLFVAGGRLLDPRSHTEVEANLLIVDGRIAGFPAAPPEGFAGDTLDARGKWVIPGLRDLHVHSAVHQAPGGVVDPIGSEEAARRMLRAGVVGFLDLFADEERIFAFRDRQRQGVAGTGAEVFAAGPCLTAPGGHCSQFPTPTRLVDSPATARREVADLVARRRPDAVKLVYEHVPEELEGKTWRPARPSIDRATLTAAIAEAAAHGVPTVIHVRSWQDVREAALAGASAVTHLPAEGAMPDDLPALLRERGTVIVPTLAVGDPGLLTERELLSSSLLAAAAGEAVLAAYRRMDPGAEELQPMIRGLGYAQELRLVSLARLAAAGVPIVAGSDSGNVGTVHGWSLHRELVLMRRAGLSAWQVLAAATTAAGDLLGRGWGLARGDEGSLLVLGASPLDDVANTQAVFAVVQRGVVVGRAGPEVGGGNSG